MVGGTSEWTTWGGGFSFSPEGVGILGGVFMGLRRWGERRGLTWLKKACLCGQGSTSVYKLNWETMNGSEDPRAPNSRVRLDRSRSAARKKVIPFFDSAPRFKSFSLCLVTPLDHDLIHLSHRATPPHYGVAMASPFTISPWSSSCHVYLDSATADIPAPFALRALVPIGNWVFFSGSACQPPAPDLQSQPSL